MNPLEHRGGRWHANPAYILDKGYGLMHNAHPHVVGFFPVLIDCQAVAHRLNTGYHCYRVLGDFVRFTDARGWTIPYHLRVDGMTTLQEYQRISFRDT